MRLLTLPSRTWRSGANCRVPESGASSCARFQRLGAECLRLLEGVEIEKCREMKGVKPVAAAIAGPGSENLTRFFLRWGVCGGVSIPKTRLLRREGLDGESCRRFWLEHLLRTRLRAIGSSSSAVELEGAGLGRSVIVGRRWEASRGSLLVNIYHKLLLLVVECRKLS